MDGKTSERIYQLDVEGKFDEAEGLVREIVDVSNPDQISLVIAARHYAMAKRFPEAREFADRIDGNYLKNPQIAYSIAPVYFETGDRERSISCLEAALDTISRSNLKNSKLEVDIRHNLKVALIRTGDNTRAKEQFAKILEIERNKGFNDYLDRIVPKYAPGVLSADEWVEFLKIFAEKSPEEASAFIERKMFPEGRPTLG